MNLFVVTKKTYTFASLLKKSTVLKSIGEMAEWSIAAVLKTVELRGSGGSNPSLSAGRQSQEQPKSRQVLQINDL